MPRKKKAEPAVAVEEPAKRPAAQAAATRKRKGATPAAEPPSNVQAQPQPRKSKAQKASAVPETQEGALYQIRAGEIMETPVFRPTEEEFADFYAYATKLDKLVGHIGVCKVIPPAGWKARQHGQGVYTRKLQF
jgi:hypothetical protein